MCGRFVLATRPDELARHFRADLDPELDQLPEPSWNVAPTRSVLAVTSRASGERELGVFRWGLVPSFAKGPGLGNRLINARAETVADKPAFRAALQRRRALVLADGFYEWRAAGDGRRQPFYFSRRDGAPLAFAGLFELWRPDATSAWLRTCTIITTQAGPDVALVHDRMPVVLEPEDQDRWLAVDASAGERVGALLSPSAAGVLVSWPVDPRVGSPRVDGPSLLSPVANSLEGLANDDGQLSFPIAGERA